jgi:hypothetical protein
MIKKLNNSNSAAENNLSFIKEIMEESYSADLKEYLI